MNYIISFQHREQYDCYANCLPKQEAKCFSDNTTLKEIAEWVREKAGSWNNDDINLLTNPQIIGITLKGGEK